VGHLDQQYGSVNSMEEKKTLLEKNGTNNTVKVIGLLVVLAVVIFCLWYFVLSDNSNEIQLPIASNSSGSLLTSTGGGEGEESPLDVARRLIQDKAEIEELEATLEQFEAIKGAEDAVFILTRVLAPHAVKHQLRYASFFDPTDSRPTGSIAKNGSIAFAEYTLAIKAGEEKALEAQRKILEWARSNSNSGRADVEALLKRTGVH
jgi:hypothetical protein